MNIKTVGPATMVSSVTTVSLVVTTAYTCPVRFEGSVTLPSAPIGANCASRPERKAAKSVVLFAEGMGLVPLEEGLGSGIEELESWRVVRLGELLESEGSLSSLEEGSESLGVLGSAVDGSVVDGSSVVGFVVEGSDDPSEPEPEPEPSGAVVFEAPVPSGVAPGSAVVLLPESEGEAFGSFIPSSPEVEFVALDDGLPEALNVKVTTDPGRPGLTVRAGKGVNSCTVFVEGHDDTYGVARVITCLGVRGVYTVYLNQRISRWMEK